LRGKEKRKKKKHFLSVKSFISNAPTPSTNSTHKGLLPTFSRNPKTKRKRERRKQEERRRNKMWSLGEFSHVDQSKFTSTNLRK